MTSTTGHSTLAITAARWRLLNALADAGGPVQGHQLVFGQDASDEDLSWMGERQLVTATWVGRTTRLDLVEHLRYHGSTIVIALRLTARGRLVVGSRENTLLRCLAAVSTRRLRLNRLMAQAGVDAAFVGRMLLTRRVAASLKSTGDQLSGEDLDHAPPQTVLIRLTERGRAYLPFHDA